MSVWKYEDADSIQSLLTTELNSLASGSRKTTAAWNNDSLLAVLGDLELFVGFAVAPAVGSLIQAFLLPSVDDTNYPVGDDSTTPQQLLSVGHFEVRLSQTGGQYLVIPAVRLCPRNQKFLIINQTAQAFAASNNTLKLKPYKFQQV